MEEDMQFSSAQFNLGNEKECYENVKIVLFVRSNVCRSVDRASWMQS